MAKDYIIRISAENQSEDTLYKMVSPIARFVCHCIEPDQYFSRIEPMGYYCGKCGLEVAMED